MKKKAKIYIAGHKGLIGFAFLNRLKKGGFTNLIYKSHQELDLLSQAKVERFFKKEHPQYIILTAARVGGIQANILYPAKFIYENLMIQSNVIHSAYAYNAKKLLFFGSGCTYPRECLQPMKEEYLLTGSLEPTNEAYAIAKIAGMKMCEAYNRQYSTKFMSVMLTSAYGPNDNFDIKNSHVIPALIRRFYEAKINKQTSVTIWGSGNPKREFIYVDDIVDASLFLMDNYTGSDFINVGSGQYTSIGELARLIKDAVGFKGEIIFDKSKPDGMPTKTLDCSKLVNLGWKAKISIEEGIKRTYTWYKDNLR